MNNLYLIIGEDSKLIDFYLLEILNKIKFVEDNKIIYDMNINNLNDVLDEASMISLFSSTKVIIGNNFDISKLSDNEIDYLSKYVGNINKDVYIILIASKVDARLKSYKIFKDNFKIIDTSKSDNSSDIYNYVINIINEKNYKVNKYDIEYFISKVGNDINNIKLELDKLFIYKEDDKTIDKEDIDLLIIDNIDNVIYEFTNAVIEKNIQKVSYMYNNFKKENVSIDYLISSLANVFRQILIIKMLYNEGKSNFEIAKVIGKKEFYVKKMLERIYVYSEEDIENLIIRLAKIDYEYKSGKSNIDMLELFLLNM